MTCLRSSHCSWRAEHDFLMQGTRVRGWKRIGGVAFLFGYAHSKVAFCFLKGGEKFLRIVAGHRYLHIFRIYGYKNGQIAKMIMEIFEVANYLRFVPSRTPVDLSSVVSCCKGVSGISVALTTSLGSSSMSWFTMYDTVIIIARTKTPLKYFSIHFNFMI